MTRLIPWPRSAVARSRRSSVVPRSDRRRGSPARRNRRRCRPRAAGAADQVQVGDAEVLEEVEVLGHALEVAGEPLGVAGVAEHPRLLEPVRSRAAAGRAGAGRRAVRRTQRRRRGSAG